MPESFKLDALIIGGGVAGLWLLNRLRNEGYKVWLLEKDQLGAGQSIASQGMIHGGIKYALGGKLTNASTAIADMPAHWKQCLAGTGDVDLKGCNLLSDDYYMWPRNSMRSRLNAFLGSKALEARVDKVAPEYYPAFFKNKIPGPLYQLQDIVLDVPSLLSTLSENQQDCIFKINWQQAELVKNPDGSIKSLLFSDGNEIQAQRYLFCCGAGAQALMDENHFTFTQMQRRPLRMTMVKHEIRDPVYVHCVSDKLTMTPEVTITSHRNHADEPVWYLGGELAEQGAGQSEAELIDTAIKKLNSLFPWHDFSQAQWATLEIDRAEEKQDDGLRPADTSIAVQHNIMLCWPTKLTLAPNLANQVIELFQQAHLSPGESVVTPSPTFLEKPGIAPTPWEYL